MGSIGSYLGATTNYPDDEALMYEAFYSYDVNDGMTITPLFFVKESLTAGTVDKTGVMVKTSFSF